MARYLLKPRFLVKVKKCSLDRKNYICILVTATLLFNSERTNYYYNFLTKDMKICM